MTETLCYVLPLLQAVNEGVVGANLAALLGRWPAVSGLVDANRLVREQR